MKICSFEGCGEPIPIGKKSTAMYCSDECYYFAKCLRSTARYYKLKSFENRHLHQESILAGLYMSQCDGAVIKLAIAEKAGLDLGYSEKELADECGGIWKSVGKYAYLIEPKLQIVKIWKQP